MGLNVNYLEIPDYCRQGCGRIADRDQYHSVHRLPPPDVRQFVGQRLPPVTPALAPIADRVVIASQRGAIDNIGHITSMAVLVNIFVTVIVNSKTDPVRPVNNDKCANSWSD